jgi:hypothetical protein
LVVDEVNSLVEYRGALTGGPVLFGPFLIALQQRVILQEALDLLVQFQSRKLQQPDRLLQLGRQCEVLG